LQAFLDSVLQDAADNNHAGDLGSGHTTPTAAPRQLPQATSSSADALPRLSTSNLARTLVHDVAVSDSPYRDLCWVPLGALRVTLECMSSLVRVDGASDLFVACTVDRWADNIVV
jgi:hypothetical protein